MKTLRFMSFAAGLALLFTGCTGPEGPQGTPGTDGNANVTASFYTASSWNVNATNYYVNISDGNLTQSILDNGATEVFLTIDNGTTWAALPFTYFAGGPPNYDYIFSYTTNINDVNVYWTYDGTGVGSSPLTVYAPAVPGFKIIDIASSVMKRHPNTNWKNYYEVMSVLQTENPTSGIQVQTIAPAPVQSVK